MTEHDDSAALAANALSDELFYFKAAAERLARQMLRWNDLYNAGELGASAALGAAVQDARELLRLSLESN